MQFTTVSYIAINNRTSKYNHVYSLSNNLITGELRETSEAAVRVLE